MDDFSGIAAAAARLDALGLFASVASGMNPGPGEPQTTGLPAAWVYPVSWRTADSWSDPTAEARLRTVAFEVIVSTDPADQEAPTPQRLAVAVEGALHGQTLDASWPALTRCETGRYQRLGRGVNRTHELIVTGEFSYEV